jgi:hypothetical protein
MESSYTIRKRRIMARNLKLAKRRSVRRTTKRQDVLLAAEEVQRRDDEANRRETIIGGHDPETDWSYTPEEYRAALMEFDELTLEEKNVVGMVDSMLDYETHVDPYDDRFWRFPEEDIWEPPSRVFA